MNSKKLKKSEFSNSLSSTTPKNKPTQQSPSIENPEIPIKSIKELADRVVVSNSWQNTESDAQYISRIVYMKEHDLGNLNVLRCNKAENTLRIKYQGIDYLLRKVTLDVAKAVLNIYTKIRNSVEKIAGYLMTVSGMVYLITKVENTLFSFNSEDSNQNYKDPRSFEPEERLSVFEKALDQFIELNKSNLLLLDFSIKNIMLSGNSVLIGDLRKLRMSLDPKAFISSIKSFILHLLSMKLITKQEALYLLAYYMGGNTQLCLSWFKSKHSFDAKEEVDVLDALEQEIIAPQFA
ncbi:MAG: hypothetical protein PHU63_01675 [Candidatus ainarchaeum sp.]|nr:hypothetical protein [Candidatus ainarchaeum sp.]